MISIATQKMVFQGVVKDGVVVLDDAFLPEGTVVSVALNEPELFVALPEFRQWDKAGRDAWSLISEWEREEGVDPETLA
jgi:hypothetical protein